MTMTQAVGEAVKAIWDYELAFIEHCIAQQGAGICCDCAPGKTCTFCEDGKAAGIIDEHNKLIAGSYTQS